MDAILNHEFTSLTLLYGVIFLVGGVLGKLFPPKRMTWYNSTEREYTPQKEAIWRERVKFATTPYIILGLLSIVLSFLPFLFEKAFIFTFSSANILFIASLFLLKSMEKKHIKKLFDEHGNRIENA